MTLELPIWIPSLSGTAAARGFSSPVRTSLGDAFESNDTLVGLVGRVEVGYGKWTVVADGAYLKWENNVTGPGGADINFRAETFLVDIDIFYRIGEWQLGAAKSPDDVPASLVLDIGPGMRYVHVGLNLDAVHGYCTIRRKTGRTRLRRCGRFWPWTSIGRRKCGRTSGAG